MKHFGVCCLTQNSGAYVKSHLLPKALTRAGRTQGEKYIEHGPDLPRAMRRADSWYDDKLVTAEGERILERCDTAGISELRRMGLVWSSGRHVEISIDGPSRNNGMGEYLAFTQHPKRLRLFVLSLLWRAAATSIAEFDQIRLSDDEVEYLRNLIENGEVAEPDEFPIVFLSLLGPGFHHNHTPISQCYGDLEMFRFYLDGLIILVGGRDLPAPYLDEMEAYLVGFQNKFKVMARPFRDSRQERDLFDVVSALTPATPAASN